MVKISCPKCGKPGSIYYTKIRGKSGQTYYSTYCRHIEGRASRQIIQSHYVKAVTKEEYEGRPKRYPLIILTGEDLNKLRKLIERFHENRETSNAELLTKILDSIEKGSVK